MFENKKLAVLIPCYRCKSHIEKVVKGLPEFVDQILIIDDKCPEQTGKFAQSLNIPNLNVLFNKENLGVGGAVKAGYEYFKQTDIDIIIKIDGDEQMNPHHIPHFCNTIIKDNFDYIKGNRFYHGLPWGKMPIVRLLGNVALSYINRFIIGLSEINDPTNGYTAIRCESLRELKLSAISNDFFFESDILYHMVMMKKKVKGIPVDTIYQHEKSNLGELNVIPSFFYKHIKNYLNKKYWVKYYEKNRNSHS